MAKIGNNLTERAGLYLAGLRFTKLGMAFREQEVSDFGIDAHAELISDDSATGSLIALQIKSGSSFFKEKTPTGWWFRFDPEHAEYWRNHALPVLVVLCNTDNEQLYWQRISKATIIRTGKQFKVEIPRAQVVGEECRSMLSDVCTRPALPNSYSVLKEEDVSHAGARCLAVHLLLTGTPTKSEVAAIARESTTKQIGSDYTRNPLVEAVWSGVNAHVVWVYLYQTLDDFKQSNCLARSYWIDPELDPAMRPAESDGENVGLSVMLIWNPNHEFIRKSYGSAQVSKQIFLRTTDQLVEQLSSLVTIISKEFETHVTSPNAFASAAKHLQDTRLELAQVTQPAHDLPTPPLECEDLDSPVQALIAIADNLLLFLADERVWDDNAATALTKSNLRDFSKTYERWRFEREKV